MPGGYWVVAPPNRRHQENQMTRRAGRLLVPAVALIGLIAAPLALDRSAVPHAVETVTSAAPADARGAAAVRATLAGAAHAALAEARAAGASDARAAAAAELRAA